MFGAENPYTPAAALIAAAVLKAQKEGQNFWLSGYVGKEDHLALEDIAGKSKAIHFPFVSVGWKTKDEAVSALSHIEKPEKIDNYVKVVFEVTAAHGLEFAGCRVVGDRVNGSIDAAAEKQDDIHVFKVAATHLAVQTVAEWKAAKDAKPADAAAAATAAPAEGEKKEEAPAAEPAAAAE